MNVLICHLIFVIFLNKYFFEYITFPESVHQEGYVYALVWPGTWQSEHINESINYFTIHGLWPNYNKTPTNCTFELNNLNGLQPELERYWGTFSKEPNKYFWEHEWFKHGCVVKAKEHYTEYGYFSLGLILRSKYDPYHQLHSNGIIPRNTPYKYENIKIVINNMSTNIGTINEIVCVRKGYKYYLEGIYFCLDNDVSHINCPKHLSNCPHDELIYYPEVW